MKTPIYLQLSIGAPKRLAHLRALAAKAPADQTALKARAYGFINWEAAHCTLSAGFNGTDAHKVAVWYAHTGAQFRNEKYADECADVNWVSRFTGWFCDAEQNNKARGIVGSLTHGRFIAGYELSDSGERVYFPDVHTSERDAALMADEHARVIAELECAYSERYNEAQALETKNEDALARLRECITLRNTQCFNYVRDEITELCEQIRNAREELRTTYAGVL